MTQSPCDACENLTRTVFIKHRRKTKIMNQITASTAQRRADLMARVDSVLPILQKNAARTDAEGIIPEENFAALKDAGLGRILRPRRFGGIETDLKTSLEVQVRLAMACGSTSWVTGLGNVSSFGVAALFPLEAQEEVWGDNDHCQIALVSAKAEATKQEVPGGWRVSGRWRYGSGSAYAQWVAVGVPHTDENGEPDTVLVLVPISEVVIEKSWEVSGMRGTASDTIVLKDIFVPPHRQASMNAAYAGKSASPYMAEHDTIYRTPFLPVFSLCIAASPVGLAKAALAVAAETAPKRKLPFFGIPQSESETNQVMIANAAIAADSAEMHMLRSAAEADAAAAAGMRMTNDQRVAADTIAAARYSNQAVRTVVRVMMSSTFANSNPLQRIWRDCEIASSHFWFSEIMLAGYGKTIFGGEASLVK